MSYVNERFLLNDEVRESIRSRQPNFGFNGFGELTFYRTYSRTKPDGGQESWADCVIRVIEGVFSIRKDWYIKNHIEWNSRQMQMLATDMAQGLFDMEWLPPGRGLYAMGTDFVYERGSMALQNCGFTLIGEEMGADFEWMMDALMCGVGVGFSPVRDDRLKLYRPTGTVDFEIPDSREGWAQSTRLLIESFLFDKPKPVFSYRQIRMRGLPIKGFGGIASGPDPLRILHQQIEQWCEWYLENHDLKYAIYDSVFLKTDIANCIGCCVVAGNVRRSAELSCAPVNDKLFLDLKDYKKFPYRATHGWMSNNSALLDTREDFEQLGEIAKRVIRNGEPGYINRKNLPYGRIGKFEDWEKYGLRQDKAIGFNPCGEQPLEDKELCTLVETLPTRCPSSDRWLRACKHATFYASTVTLLPTHKQETNAVMQRNRRIGVGIIDFTGWKAQLGVHKATRLMRDGYDAIRTWNHEFADSAGVPRSIRVTTIKPGGTTPKLAGRTSGMSHPNFEYMIRRIRVGHNMTICKFLMDKGIPHELDVKSMNTEVFEFPVYNGLAKPASKVSLWEQAANLVLLQREWSDNAVSNTLNFRPKWALVHETSIMNGDTLEDIVKAHDAFEPAGRQKCEMTKNEKDEIVSFRVYEYDPEHEEEDIEPVLSFIAPYTKSVSLLPHSNKGAYPQMPEEGITKEEYDRRVKALVLINWSEFGGSDGQDERYCSADSCELKT